MTALEELRLEIEEAAGKAYPDRVIVHAEGRIGARLMLIGEAPGEQEEILRRPFVGKAGKNLDEFLELAGIRREEIYISNTVRFRPTRLSKAGNTVNRPPLSREVDFFAPFLLREIALVRPGIVATLGNVPLKALAGKKATVGELHGRFIEMPGYTLYPMYHPASLIYNPSLREIYTADILRLKDSAF